MNLRLFTSVVYIPATKEYIDGDPVWVNPGQVAFVRPLGTDPDITDIHAGVGIVRVRGAAAAVADGLAD